eukprot:jgi/Chlat1/5322/Chrsp35S05201
MPGTASNLRADVLAMRKMKSLYKSAKSKWNKEPTIVTMVKNATSNEAWGPHGSDMNFIANASRDPFDYSLIMNTLLSRLDEKPHNWRKVHKALTILEFCSTRGSPRVLEDLCNYHAHKASTHERICLLFWYMAMGVRRVQVRFLAKNFHFVDPEDSKDKGISAEALLAIIEAAEASSDGRGPVRLDVEEYERRRSMLGPEAAGLGNAEVAGRIEGFGSGVGGGRSASFSGGYSNRRTSDTYTYNNPYGDARSSASSRPGVPANEDEEQRQIARALAESMKTYKETEQIRQAIKEDDVHPPAANGTAAPAPAPVEESMALVVIDEPAQEMKPPTMLPPDTLSQLLFGDSEPANPVPQNRTSASDAIFAQAFGHQQQQQQQFLALPAPGDFMDVSGGQRPQQVDLMSAPAQLGHYAPTNPFVVNILGGGSANAGAPLAIGWHADSGSSQVYAPAPTFYRPQQTGVFFPAAAPASSGTQNFFSAPSQAQQPGFGQPSRPAPASSLGIPGLGPNGHVPRLDDSPNDFLGKGKNLVDLSLSNYTPVRKGAVDVKTLAPVAGKAYVNAPMGRGYTANQQSQMGF